MIFFKISPRRSAGAAVIRRDSRLRIDGHEGHGTVGCQGRSRAVRTRSFFMVVIPSRHRSTLRVLAPGNVFENTNVTFAQVDHAMLRWPELAERGAPRRR